MNASHVLEPQAVIVQTVMIPHTPVLIPLVRKEINLDYALEIRQERTKWKNCRLTTQTPDY